MAGRTYRRRKKAKNRYWWPVTFIVPAAIEQLKVWVELQDRHPAVYAKTFESKDPMRIIAKEGLAFTKAERKSTKVVIGDLPQAVYRSMRP